jgi:hypothetical protein
MAKPTASGCSKEAPAATEGPAASVVGAASTMAIPRKKEYRQCGWCPHIIIHFYESL